jgi:hypothetical protein
MNTVECRIDESNAQQNEQEVAQIQRIVELDDSKMQQVAGGKAVIPAG